jgi:hypothetical protein
MEESIGHPRTLRFGGIGLVLLLGILSSIVALLLSPNVDYSLIPNSTLPLFGVRYQIEYTSIPTIINGITASTSVIIGFTGAMVGLFYKIFEDDDKTKALLLVSAFYEIVPLAFLLFVYILLPIGYLDQSLKLALVALGLSLISFANVMIGSLYRIVWKKKNPTPMLQPTAPTSPKENNNSSANNGNKSVNIVIKMDAQNSNSKDETETVNITVEM